MKPRINPLLIASVLLSSGVAHAADYTWGSGTAQNFTINRTDWARDMPDTGAANSIDNVTGDMGVYWRGSASDRTFIHFDLGSLIGSAITSDVSLNTTVNAQYGGTLTNSTINTASAAWSAVVNSTAPAITAIAGATNATGTFTTGQTASWVIPQATFASYVGSSTFYGLALAGASSTNAHFSGASTLTGSYLKDQVRVLGGTDWTAVTWDGGTSTATLASDASGGDLFIAPGATFAVVGSGTLGNGAFSGRIANGGTLNIGSAANQTLGGVISGAAGLTKSGAGTLKLTSINTFTGSINLNAGTLEAAAATGGNASGIGNGANTISIAQGATLLTSTNARTCGYHSGTVNLNGGTITFNTQDNSFAAGKTLTFDVAPGTLNGSGQWRMRDANAKVAVTAAASGSTISVANLTLTTSGGTHTFDVADGSAASDLTISSAISGHYGGEKLTKAGAGTLALTGTNSYTGATTVNAGTLLVTGSLAGPVTVNSATVAGTGPFSGTVSVGASGAIEPAGTGTIGTLTADNTLTLAGETRMEIAKSGITLNSDKIAGTGAVVFGGVLKITATGDAPQLGDSFQLFSGTGSLSQSFSSIEAPVLAAGLSWDVSQLTVTGSITVVNYAAVPTFSLPAGGYIGAQVITLTSESGATIYFTLDGSPPTLSSASGASPVTGIPVPNSATVAIRAFATKPGQAPSPEVSAVYTTIPTAVWSVNDNGLWSEAAKWLQNAIPDGAEDPVDFQTTAQTTDTTVTLDSNRTAGAMTFGNANAFNWTLATSNGSILTLDNGASAPAITVAANTATIAAPLAGTNGLAISGAGTLVLSGANSYSGDTAVASGSTLRLGASDRLPDGTGKGNLALTGTLDLGAFSDTINGLIGTGPVVKSAAGTSTLTIGGANTTSTYDGVISNAAGTLSLVKTGTGTLTLNQAQSYNGSTTVNGNGNLVIKGATGSPTASGYGEVMSGSLELDGGSLALAQLFIGRNAYQATSTDQSTVTITNGSLTVAGPDFIMGQTINGTNLVARLIQTGGSCTFNGSWMGIGNGGGASEIDITGGTFSNSVTGMTLGVRGNSTLSIGGTGLVTLPSLIFGHAAVPNNVTNTVNLNGGALATDWITSAQVDNNTFNFNGGTLRATGDRADFMQGLTTANVRDGGARIDTNGRNITINQALVHSTIGGDSATDGGLTKSGAGTLILTGSSSYTGNTAVNGGTLQLNGALTASPQVSVASGATLSGSGAISGTVSAGGTIAPGAGVGTLATGTIDLTGGAFACEIDNAAADRLNVTGDCNLTGATLAVTVLNPPSFSSAVILTYTGTLTGEFSTPTLPSGVTLKHDPVAKAFRLVRGGDYYSWATANSVTGGPNGDSDNDGIRNLVEYALALNPAASDGQAGSYTPATGVISFTKRQEAIDNGDLTYIIQTSTNLIDWSPAVTHAAGNSSTTISTTLTGGGPLKFARLLVTTSASAP